MSIIEFNRDQSQQAIGSTTVYGVETAAHVAQSGFHKVGVKLDQDMSAHDVMCAAGLDWTVKKAPLYSCGQRVPGKYALVRESDDRIFDVVGKEWQPTQNKDMFDFFHNTVKAGDLVMEAAGASANGRHVWAVAKTKNPVVIGDSDDVIDGRIIFSVPHVYGKAITLTNMSHRLQCANQIIMGNNKAFARFAHNHASGFNAERVGELVSENDANLRKFKEAADFLISKPLLKGKFIEYLRRVFKLVDPDQNDATAEAEKRRARNANKISKLLQVSDTMAGAAHGRGTWWQALNTVSYQVDHVANDGNPAKQLDSAFTGTGATRKATALKLALEFAA